jgi:hypothetical protein
LDKQDRAFGNFRTHAISSEFSGILRSWHALVSGDGFSNDLSIVAAILFLKGFRFRFQMLDKETWFSSEKFRDLIGGSKYWQSRFSREPMTDLKLEPEFYSRWILILNEADLALRHNRTQQNKKSWMTPSFNYFLNKFTRPQMEALLWSVYSGQIVTPSALEHIEIENVRVILLAGGFSSLEADRLATQLVPNRRSEVKTSNNFNRYELHQKIFQAVDPFFWQKDYWQNLEAIMQNIASEMYISSRPGFLLDSHYEIFGVPKTNKK